MTEKVSIQLDAIDNASATIGQFFNVIQSGAEGGELAFGLLGAAAQGVISFVQGSVDDFLQYTETVKDFARNTGMSVEESGRLIQMADDVRLSTDSLSTAMRNMEKNGMSPSIETMKKLADQYVALQSPAARAQFLLDNFGKSGLEMGKLLEQGSDGVDKLYKAVNAGLVPTEEAIRQAELYKREQDNLNDSFEALQQRVGSVSVEPLTIGMKALEEYVTKATSSWQEFFSNLNLGTQAVNLIKAGFDAYNKTQEDYKKITEEATKTAKEQKDAISKTKDELKAEEDALKAVSRANTDLLSLSQTIQQANDSYSQKLSDLTAKQRDEAASIDTLTLQYGAHSQKVDEMTAKYNETTGSIQKLEQEHAQAMNKIAFDLLVTKLKADGFTDAEYNMALAAGESMGVIDDASAETAKNLSILTDAASKSAGGSQKLGDILKTAMSDGKLTTAEMQDALNQLTTDQAQNSIQGLNTDLMTSNLYTSTLKDHVNDLNGKEIDINMEKTTTPLSDALDHATQLKDKLDEINGMEVGITVNYTTNGNPPKGGTFNGFAQNNFSSFAPIEGNGVSAFVNSESRTANTNIVYIYGNVVIDSPESDPANLLEAFRG